MSILISNDLAGNSISRQQTFIEPFFECPSSVQMNAENCMMVLSQVDQKSKNINQSEAFKRSKIFITNPFSEVIIWTFYFFLIPNSFTNNKIKSKISECDSNFFGSEKSKKTNNNSKLVSLIGNILVNKKIGFDLTSTLSKLEKEIMMMFLFKRKIMSAENCEKIIKNFDDNILVTGVLTKIEQHSKCNFFTMFEMVLNKILRQCFDEWMESPQKESYLDSKFHLNRISKQKTIIHFWKYLYLNSKIEKNQFSFEKIYTKIKKKLQVKRKFIKKKNYQFSKRKIKYMNIELDKKFRKDIMEFLSKSPIFIKTYNSFKNSILKDYDQFKNPFSFSVVKLQNNPFEIDIKSNIKSSIQTLIQYRSTLPKILKISDFEEIAKNLKNSKFPVTIFDYIKIFNMFEKEFDFE